MTNSRVIIGGLGFFLKDVRNLVFEENSYKICLNNGIKIKATQSEIGTIKESLASEAKIFMAADRKAMRNELDTATN